MRRWRRRGLAAKKKVGYWLKMYSSAIAPSRQRAMVTILLPPRDLTDDGSPLTLSDLDGVAHDLAVWVRVDRVLAGIDVGFNALGSQYRTSPR